MTENKRDYVGSPPTPYYADDLVTLYNGDACDVLAALPANSINCVVTSPPYFGLRDYGIDGQYGLEASPAEYVETMRAVFAEARRVLAADGTFWLNLGDKYGRSQTTNVPQTKNRPCGMPTTVQPIGDPKNLMGIPWRVAFALQDEGWTLRNAIVWHKPNAMPESVTDRLSCDYEHVFMFARSRTYWFDLDPIREPLSYPELVAPAANPIAALDQTPYPGMAPQRARARTGSRHVYGAKVTAADAGVAHRFGPNEASTLGSGPENGRNPGSVWDIPTQPFAAAHFATMPVALAERCIKAGCKPGGTVLDPFSGSGTTGLAATRLGRRYVGIDLNREYLDLSLRTRLAQGALAFDCDGSPETTVQGGVA